MLYAIAVVIVLILDQGLKYWTTVSITLNSGSVPVIEGVFSLVNIHNSGAAFGILENARWLFIILAVVFTALVVFALVRNIVRQPLGRWSAVLVTAGALGNLIDRIMNGYVVDMFRLDFMNFAVFNIADIFITVCGILFVIYLIFTKDFASDKKAPVRAEAGGKTAERRKAPPAREARGGGKHAPKAAPVEEPEEEVRAYTPRAGRVSAAAVRITDEEDEAPAPAPVPEIRPAPAAAPPRPIPPRTAVKRPEPPKIDPNDPFAEWERPSEPEPEVSFVTAEPETPVSAPVYSPVSEPIPEPIPAPPPVYTPEPVKPEVSAPVSAPAKQESAAEEDYSLDDILAEFK